MFSASVYGKQPVLACLELCWEDLTRAGVVFCESTLLNKGTGVQVLSCCSLQFSASFGVKVHLTMVWRSCGVFAVRRNYCKAFTPSALHMCAALGSQRGQHCCKH
jgi:hypothetical protein